MVWRMEDGKKTEEEGKAEEDECEEVKIKNNNDDWGHHIVTHMIQLTTGV